MTITRLSPDFAVASQLAPDDLGPIANAGFRAIVNNRPDDEEPGQPPAGAIEAQARRLGLDYAFIPVGSGLAVEPAARALKAFLAEADGPVLAYCRSGTRSAHLWNLAGQLD